MKVIVDFHVHIYPWYDLDLFFRSHIENSKRRFPDHVGGYAICLTEREGQSWFDHAIQCGERTLECGWRIKPCEDALSLCVSKGSSVIFVICGRQFVSGENIEVLCLGRDLKLIDGEPIESYLDRILDEGGIPVLPWGLGKWLGKRGLKVCQILDQYQQKIFVGDTSMRPTIWFKDKVLAFAHRLGCVCLPGSDSLIPIGEETALGIYSAQVEFDAKAPGEELVSFLIGIDSLEYPASRCSLLSVIVRFFRLKRFKMPQAMT